MVEDFAHLEFHGRTTSPWHVGRVKYGDYLYSRCDLLWGRGIRGPVLRQLWRAYCPRSDLSEGVDFSPERDCSACRMVEECPFYNLRGTEDEGEFKDRPRLIISNLKFHGDFQLRRIALATISDRFGAVVPGKAPVYIEYIPEGVSFTFEAILMADGVRFRKEFENAVRVSLKFHGWGGFCNEGFGRGEIVNVRLRGFNGFEMECLKQTADSITEKASDLPLTFTIEPMLILDKPNGSVYTSISEEGFLEKLSNCINERFWQFYGKHIHIQSKLKSLSGRARTVKIYGWSRKFKRQMPFIGIGNEITMSFEGKMDEEEALALALAKYGIGRFKNQGFGSLKMKEGGER